MGRDEEYIRLAIEEIKKENYTHALNIIERALREKYSSELSELENKIRLIIKHTMSPEDYENFYQNLYKEKSSLLTRLERKIRTWIGKRTRNLIKNTAENPRYEQIEKDIKHYNFKNILDVGCGEGHFSITLGARNPDLNVTGVDIVQYNIDKAIELNKFKNVRFIKAFAEEVDRIFEKDSFDVVMLFEILEHVISVDEVLKASLNVLRDGGMIAVTVPDGIKNPGHVRYFSDELISDYFAWRKGFRMERIYPLDTPVNAESKYFWRYITFFK